MATPKSVAAIPEPAPAGGFFADFVAAMNDYAKDYVKLSVVSVAPETPPSGNVVNVNDVWKFKVRAKNNGALNLTGLTIHIEGQNGVMVSTAPAGPWVSSVFTDTRDVDAYEQKDGAYYYFKAPASPTTGSVDLVRAHVSSYDANLNYVLNGLSGHSDPPFGSYSATVAGV